jgi:hypothetical protein
VAPVSRLREALTSASRVDQRFGGRRQVGKIMLHESEMSAERWSAWSIWPRAGDRHGRHFGLPYGVRPVEHRPGFGDRDPVGAGRAAMTGEAGGTGLMRKGLHRPIGAVGSTDLECGSARPMRRKREGRKYRLQCNRIGRHEDGASSYGSAQAHAGIHRALSEGRDQPRRVWRHVHDKFSPKISPQSDLDASKDCIGCSLDARIQPTGFYCIRFKNVKPNSHRSIYRSAAFTLMMYHDIDNNI